jgi:hypothetical protein
VSEMQPESAIDSLPQPWLKLPARSGQGGATEGPKPYAALEKYYQASANQRSLRQAGAAVKRRATLMERYSSQFFRVVRAAAWDRHKAQIAAAECSFAAIPERKLRAAGNTAKPHYRILTGRRPPAVMNKSRLSTHTEHGPLDRLVLYEYTARTHSSAPLKQIANRSKYLRLHLYRPAHHARRRPAFLRRETGQRRKNRNTHGRPPTVCTDETLNLCSTIARRLSRVGPVHTAVFSSVCRPLERALSERCGQPDPAPTQARMTHSNLCWTIAQRPISRLAAVAYVARTHRIHLRTSRQGQSAGTT